MLHLARDLLEPPVTGFARQALQPASRLLGLLGQRPRRVTAAPLLAALLSRRPALLPLELLLLPAREFAQLLHQLVDFLVGGLLLAALHGLVLVAQFVGLQLEEIGQVLGAGSLLPPPASARLLGLLRHEALVGLLGLLELPERALLGLNRPARLHGPQGVHRLVHRLDGDRQRFHDALERLVRPADPAVHDPLAERLHLLPQPLLGQRDADDVLLPALGRVALPVADQVEGRGNDLALQRRQILLHVAAPAPATASLAPAALGLAIVAAEGANLQEVDVGHRLVGRRRVVAHDAVVGDQVAHFQLVVLQEDGVARRHLGEGRAAGRVDLQSVGRPAVDAVDQRDIGDAQIVVGAGFQEDLLDRADRDVAPRPAEGDRRPLVVQHVDPVVRRTGHPDIAVGQEPDPVEAVVAHDERGSVIALRPGLHADRVARVHYELRGWRGEGGRDGELDAGAGQRGNVAAVLEATRGEARVAREVVDHLQPVDGGQVGDAEGEGAGADAVGLDVVRGLLGDVEEQSLECAGAVLDHRERQEAVVAVGTGVQHHVVGREAAQHGRDHEVGVARDDRVAGLDADAVRVDRFGRADGEEKCRHPVPQEPGADEKEDHGREGQAAEHAGGAADGALLDAPAVVDAPAPPHRAPHHLARQLRIGEAAALGGFDGGEHTRLQ